MGFICEAGKQQRIYITNETLNILYDDLISFENMPDSPELGAFICKVICNYYKYANLDTGKIKKKNGISFQLLINNEIGSLLQNLTDTKGFEYEKDYIEALLQEYASLNYIERERVYFNYVYSCILESMDSKIQHELEFNCFEKRIHFKPYKILSDRNCVFNYVVGMSKYAGENEWRIASFKLQKITEITTFKSRDFTWRKEELSNLENACYSLDAIPYLSEPLSEARIRLTDNGEKLYKTIILFQRPRHTKEIHCEKDNHQYLFKCSEKQLYNYFIKFGADVEIISPPSLRKRFSDVHKKAASYYD